MRRVFIVMLIVLHSIVPLAVAGADASPPLARSTELDVIGLNQLTLHQNEFIEVLFTLHNTGELDDTYTFELVSEVSGLEATGLPHSKFVESGYLRQVKFNLTADANATFGKRSTRCPNLTSGLKSPLKIGVCLEVFKKGCIP